MAMLTIELPESLLLATNQSRDEFLREAQFLLGMTLFERGRLSSGRAAEIAGMTRLDFLFAVGRHGVAVADLDEYEELRAPRA
jgi:predicted HTH domain antitoxin